MKFIELNGNYIRTDVITAIRVLDITQETKYCNEIKPRVIVDFNESNSIIINKETLDECKAFADSLINQIKDN